MDTQSMLRFPVHAPSPSAPSRGRLLRALGALAVLVLVGCTAADTSMDAPAVSDAAAAIVATRVEVHRSPGCGCCHEWEAYMADHGFAVEAADDPGIVSFKTENGVPAGVQSCHTALIDGYVVEGHVPVEAIEDLLSRRPAIDGIALPGMPPGSPGMPGEKEGPFEILALADGETTTFGAY